jgi:serine/threonine-protein kinase
MELVEPGTTLAGLKGELATDIERALRFFVQATEGLAAIHRRGIVHRDVKPANLLVAHRHETGRNVLKVADFGVALYPGDPADAQPAVGTMGYAAPEQLRLEAVDARADVYALGVTMYEVLTGRRPHTREEIAAWWRRRHEPEAYLVPLPEPVPACVRNASVPEELSAVVHACLAHAIELRPRSMGALRFALEDVLQRVLGVPLAERSGPPCNEAAVDARKQLADLAEAMVVDGTILDSERTFLVERALALGIAPEAAGPLVDELFAEAWRRRRSEAETVLANE